MARIFVLDGRSRATLSIIRSLGKKGHEVIVGESFDCASFYSRYTTERVRYPDPRKQADLFFEFLMEWVKKHPKSILIPVRDDTTEICSRHKSELVDKVNLLLPEYEQFQIARDKFRTIEFARKHHIPHPKTILPGVDCNLENIRSEMQVPFLIKPRISSGSRGIVYVRNWNEFEKKYHAIKKEFGVPMLQEFIPQGGGFGVSLLLKNAEVYAKFTHRRIREYPLSGGPSTLREGVKHPEMEQYAVSLMQKLQWSGVAMVEFRLDKRDGVPKLMEINPRFWGSLQTAVFSGVDFPDLLYRLAQSEACPKVLDYQAGRKVRWLLMGDVLWFLQAPKTIANVKEFFRFTAKNTGYEIWNWRDPGPVYGLMKEGVSFLLNKERRKHTLERGW